MGCKAPAVSADGALGIFKRDTDNALFLGVVNRNGAAENRAQKRRRVWMWLFVAWLAISAVFVAIIAANADERLHDGSPCFNDYGEPGHWYGQHCYVDTDGN